MNHPIGLMQSEILEFHIYANKDTKHLYLPQVWTSNWMASQIEC